MTITIIVNFYGNKNHFNPEIILDQTAKSIIKIDAML